MTGGVAGSLEGGRLPRPAWLLWEEYHGEDLAPTRLLWLVDGKEMARGMDGSGERPLGRTLPLPFDHPTTCYSFVKPCLFSLGDY